MIAGSMTTPLGTPKFVATGKHADMLSIALVVISVAVLVYQVRKATETFSA